MLLEMMGAAGGQGSKEESRRGGEENGRTQKIEGSGEKKRQH